MTMTTITTENIEELRRLTKAATPGEWLYRTDPGNPTGFQHCVKLSGEFGMWICDCLDNADRVTEGGTAGERNAAFIAAANPATISALLDLAQRAMVAQPQGQALPELPKPSEEMRAYWKCDSCDGRGHDGEMHSQGYFQPPEPAQCPDCNGSGMTPVDAYAPWEVQEVARAYASQLALPAGPLDRIRKALRGRDFNDFPGNDAELLESAANVIAEDGIVRRHMPKVMQALNPADGLPVFTLQPAPAGPVPAPVDGVHWDQFPAYLIHKCEGETITEDGLQEMLAAMLKDPDYIRIATERATKAPAGQVPDGWKLVPIVPTEKMIGYGIEAYKGKCEDAYAAMVAVAPQPPASPSPEVAQPVADELKRAVEKLAHAATDAVRVLHWYHDNSGAPILDTLPGTIRRLKKALDSDAARAALCPPAEEGGGKS